jgi:hypothetical protein
MNSHYIIRCRRCLAVTGQCVCVADEKETRWVTCTKCEHLPPLSEDDPHE